MMLAVPDRAGTPPSTAVCCIQLQYKCSYWRIFSYVDRINLAVKLRGVVIRIQHAHNDAGCAGPRWDSSVYGSPSTLNSAGWFHTCRQGQHLINEIIV
ncbi:hypothetical protein AAFF_G00322400 [Aldrovandia affinis]|uniref:Uncharacterized protein n=1 Tax=Aldrovandia affinis TaxID=143900 RepID=A0AAD7SM71_9TELE|nr:hypothetical protein AAFF_G00322400 [Aldrovandia affinis]